MLITIKIEIIDKKKVGVVVLNKNNKVVILYIVPLMKLITILIYFLFLAKITLQTRKKLRTPTKYFDSANIFSSNSMTKLLKYTKINNHLINLLHNKQLLYSSIYNLWLIKLEI